MPLAEELLASAQIACQLLEKLALQLSERHSKSVRECDQKVSHLTTLLAEERRKLRVAIDKVVHGVVNHDFGEIRLDQSHVLSVAAFLLALDDLFLELGELSNEVTQLTSTMSLNSHGIVAAAPPLRAAHELSSSSSSHSQSPRFSSSKEQIPHTTPNQTQPKKRRRKKKKPPSLRQ